MDTRKHISWIFALALASAPVIGVAQSQTNAPQDQQGTTQTQNGSDKGSQVSGSEGSKTQGSGGADQQSSTTQGDTATSGSQQQPSGSAEKTAGSDKVFLPEQQKDELLSAELTGVTVYNPNDEELGSVQNVLISQDDGIRALVVGVGGFLGIGAKQVAVHFGQFQQSRTPDGDIKLVLEASRDQLEQAPAFTTVAQKQAEARKQQQQQEMAKEQQQTGTGTGSGTGTDTGTNSQ